LLRRQDDTRQDGLIFPNAQSDLSQWLYYTGTNFWLRNQITSLSLCSRHSSLRRFVDFAICCRCAKGAVEAPASFQARLCSLLDASLRQSAGFGAPEGRKKNFQHSFACLELVHHGVRNLCCRLAISIHHARRDP